MSSLVPEPERRDLIAELASRLADLDQLLGRLENAERQAAAASDALLHTRAWQEETRRTLQEERARMQRQQRAIDDLSRRARAAVDALSSYRFLPAEVHELAVELHVLETAGLIPRTAPRRLPPS
ncbi:MAG: hypothetical protein ACQSGP_01760 [Frankia sp.]